MQKHTTRIPETASHSLQKLTNEISKANTCKFYGQNKNMKTRIISGVIIGVLAVAFIYLGGPLFAALMAFFAIWGTWELCSTRNRPINWFEYAIMLSFIMLLNLKPTKDIALIVMLLIFLCTLAVFDERVTFEEICVTFLESNILGFGIRFALLIENLNK